MLKKCENIACVIEFEPRNIAQKYCSPSCQNAVTRNTKKFRETENTRIYKWKKKNPEKVKNTLRKRAEKCYLSGNLPSWMTDK